MLVLTTILSFQQLQRLHTLLTKVIFNRFLPLNSKFRNNLQNKYFPEL